MKHFKQLIPLGLIALASLVSLASLVLAQNSVFSDVPNDHWAAESVQWANINGIMTGPANMPGMFDPAGIVNRAQLATVAERVYTFQNEQVISLRNRVNDLESRIEALEEATNTMYFDAELSGDNEVPSVSTNGTGTATLTLKGNTLNYDISVQNLSSPITAAHFHMGAEGVNGNPIHTITFTNNTANGTWNNVSQEYIDDFKAGDIYINVHTENATDGEIRGQVMPQ